MMNMLVMLHSSEEGQESQTKNHKCKTILDIMIRLMMRKKKRKEGEVGLEIRNDQHQF